MVLCFKCDQSTRVICAASFMCHFVGLGFMYTFGNPNNNFFNIVGVFVIPLAEDFQTGRGNISWIGSATAGLNLFFAVGAGILADRIHPR